MYGQKFTTTTNVPYFLTAPIQSHTIEKKLQGFHSQSSLSSLRRIYESNDGKTNKIKGKSSCCEFRNSIQKFSDDTTLHGFKELYYSKSLIWKIIWLVVILAAIVVSVIQVYQSVNTAAENPTTTIIQPLTEDVLYPPIKICYLHWMYWVNWSSVTSLGFDRNSALYGMSFLSDIVSETAFNVSEAKLKF